MKTAIYAWILLTSIAPAQSLRDLAEQRGIHIGAAVDPSHFSETLYADTLSREFNQAQPENAMKFGLIHPARSTYNFGPPDSIAAFAKTHGMALRGHTLVWYNQNPSWVTNGNFTPSQLAVILQDHIKTVVEHYAGQVYAWDVVNEAFNDNGTFRSTVWSDSPGIGLPGTAYIEQAMRWARAADPAALLFYNDYNGETVNAKSDAIYKMAQDFKTRGVPLDGIGLQMHFTANPGSLASIDANIKRLTDLGLQVQITELDVRLAVDPSGTATAAMLATQAQIYRDMVAVCLKYPLCTAIQTWGFTDKYSWVPSTFSGQGAALEFDSSYRAKPAYNAMQSALQTSPPVIRAESLTNAASYSTGAVAPGEIVTLFGSTFGAPSLVAAQAGASGTIGAVLAGTRLLFDDVPAPLLYTRVGQTGAIVPFGVAGKPSVQMTYEYQGIRSDAVTMKVTATQPGLFTLDSSGQGAAANPARKGGVIVLFATGGGVTNPASMDGQIAGQLPLPVPLGAISVTIGGVACAVPYAGAAPGLVAGALQINVLISSDVPSGEQPVVLTIGGVPSQAAATVWIE